MDLSLLLPEWQGSATDAAVAQGARALAAHLGVDRFVEIDAPDDETLEVRHGVIGLGSIAPRFARALEAIRERQPARIFTVGGTCGVELAPVSYLNDRYRGDLAVVWLDAHADLNTPETSPSGRFHGMVLRTLLGAGPAVLVDALPRRLSPGQVVLAGARDLDRDEAAFVSDSAVSLLPPADLLVPDRVTGRIRAAGFTRVYVHLDLDVLDPAAFPDTLVPAAGGASIDQVVETVAALDAALDVVGFSVVEFRPRSADAVTRVARLLERCGVTIGALAGA
ncbi:MAG: arginase family protein [Vicinamibacterales bacterium]